MEAKRNFYKYNLTFAELLSFTLHKTNISLQMYTHDIHCEDLCKYQKNSKTFGEMTCILKVANKCVSIKYQTFHTFSEKLKKYILK